MSQRYFVAALQVYEGVRLSLNEAWSLPNDKGTVTCLEPAATAPVDDNGEILLAVHADWCEFP
jgi:hypothetical protein